MTECRCWNNYPNIMHKKRNGSWKCVDCFRCIKDHKDDYKHKTVCIKIVSDTRGAEHD